MLYLKTIFLPSTNCKRFVESIVYLFNFLLISMHGCSYFTFLFHRWIDAQYNPILLQFPLPSLAFIPGTTKSLNLVFVRFFLSLCLLYDNRCSFRRPSSNVVWNLTPSFKLIFIEALDIANQWCFQYTQDNIRFMSIGYSWSMHFLVFNDNRSNKFI